MTLHKRHKHQPWEKQLLPLSRNWSPSFYSFSEQSPPESMFPQIHPKVRPYKKKSTSQSLQALVSLLNVKARENYN